MIFQYTWEWVIDVSPHTGKPKTRTSRIKKSNENLRFNENDVWNAVVFTNRSTNGGDPVNKWQIGGIYAVQPNRGVKQVGRIQICSITEQDVREITEDEAKAEGFASAARFFDTWIAMHDKPLVKKTTEWFTNRQSPVSHSAARDVYELFCADRPAERYQAWVLDFTLVKE